MVNMTEICLIRRWVSQICLVSVKSDSQIRVSRSVGIKIPRDFLKLWSKYGIPMPWAVVCRLKGLRQLRDISWWDFSIKCPRRIDLFSNF